MRDAGMLGVLTEEGVTSLAKFRNGALPDPAEPGNQVNSKPRWANAKFRLYCGKKRVVASFWAKAKQRWPDRILALAYGAAGFSGSGSIGCRGVLVSQMLKEAVRQWLRPVYSEAKRSQVRGLMCSTSNNIRFYDRDVSAALNIRRCAVGPGPRPTELCY
ncbi:hypothetical protein QJQ45_004327 [Haematococcus lacustris]|nr:hypothetical protein QJQ45_004327 [Haematococcus lacustris]